MHLIPDTWSHFHMLVSVFPLVGLIFVLGFYVTAIATNNEPAKRICLLALGLLGVIAIPTYMSGDSSIAELMKNAPVTQDPGTPDRVFYHSGWGYAALVLLVATGIAAFVNLYRFPKGKHLSQNAIHLVLGLSLATLFFMMIVGELGWVIGHR